MGDRHVSPLSAALGCRCPRCGQGALYNGFLALAERCGVCGLGLKEANSGDGPAVFIMFIVGGLVVPLALWVEFSFEPPIWVHALLWPGFVIASSLVLLRPLKALMVALQFRHQASDSGTVDYEQDA